MNHSSWHPEQLIHYHTGHCWPISWSVDFHRNHGGSCSTQATAASNVSAVHNNLISLSLLYSDHGLPSKYSLVQSLNVKEGFDIQLLHSKKSVGLTVEKTVGLFTLQSHINFILVYNTLVKLINERTLTISNQAPFLTLISVGQGTLIHLPGLSQLT